MTEQLTSPSNGSIDQNLLRLNSSSCCFVSPSQSGFGSSLKDNLVHFEEFKCSPQHPCPQVNIKKQPPAPPAGLMLGKKKLTIKIDENYQNENIAQPVRFEKYERPQKAQKNKMKLSHILQNDVCNSEQSSMQIGNLQLISPVESKNITKFYELQTAMKELEGKYESQHQMLLQKQKKLAIAEQKISSLSAQLEEKTSQCQFRGTRMEFLEQKLRQKEIQSQKRRQELQQLSEQQFSSSLVAEFEQKVREKDSKIRQLVKINEKLKNLNKDLIREVKISQKKVRDLEKQIQSNLCIATQQNIHRLKQSSLKLKEKENYERYNGSSHNHHTKTERDSLHACHNLNTTKQKEVSFAATSSVNTNARKSLQRKKNGNGNTISAGQLSQPKKTAPGRIGSCSSSNTILSKKLVHK